ncbi:MAG: hypothetical protein E7Z63_00995 [Thermoplasmata archaeon]|nr:hypothetical protein [Thermoplasmata archaeon]
MNPTPYYRLLPDLRRRDGGDAGIIRRAIDLFGLKYPREKSIHHIVVSYLNYMADLGGYDFNLEGALADSFAITNAYRGGVSR